MYNLPLTAEEVKERLLKVQKLSADAATHSAGYESANELIRIDLGYTIEDGSEIKFKAPVDGARTTGLIIYYPDAEGTVISTEFAFADANGNNVGAVDNLFAENAVVKVILDLDTNNAFVQNADTNKYLEGRFDNLKTDITEVIYKQNEAPTDAEEGALWLDLDEEAAVGCGGSGGGVSSWNDLTDKPFGEEVITVATLSMDESNENNINDGDYTILYYFGDASNIVEGKNYEMMIDNETIGSFCMHTYGRPFDVTILYDGGYGMSTAYVSIDNKIWHNGSEIFVPVNGLYMYDIGLTNAFDVVERNITTIESKYIPTGFMSWNDLKDKPFYGGEEILITQGCPVTNGTVINIYDGIPDKCTISIGWDSTSYKFDYEYGRRTSFGNESLNFWMAPDTGEPFYVSINKDDYKIVFNVKDSEEHYVTINAVSTITPISEKYIPDSIARKSDIPAGGGSDACNVLIEKSSSGGEGSWVYTCNKTYQEIDTAWKSKLPVVAFMRADKPTGSQGDQTAFVLVKFANDSYQFCLDSYGAIYIQVASDDTVTYVNNSQ